jgi:hypothetical protein
MMLQRLTFVANSLQNNENIVDSLNWKKMQSQIQTLISKQQMVNDLLITAKVLALERIHQDVELKEAWTSIGSLLNGVKLDTCLGTDILKHLKTILWYYKESQKNVNLETAKYWFEYLQRLETIYQKQDEICIELKLLEDKASNIFPLDEYDLLAPFWIPIATLLQQCM